MKDWTHFSSAARGILKSLGGFLVGQGYLTDESATVLVGSGMALLGFLWSHYFAPEKGKTSLPALPPSALGLLAVVITLPALPGCQALQHPTAQVAARIVGRLALSTITGEILSRNPEVRPWIYEFSTVLEGTTNATPEALETRVRLFVANIEDPEIRQDMADLTKDVTDLWRQFFKANFESREALLLALNDLARAVRRTSEPETETAAGAIILEGPGGSIILD